MRIIAGRLRGKTLAAPADARVRPTTDRVKESLFNLIAHAPWAPPLDGARVLDLFAGTGQLGLECLSRGAVRVCFIDDHPESRGLIRRNIEACGAMGVTKLLSRPATHLEAMPKIAGGPFDLVFADPPYGKDLGPLAMRQALAGGWLAPGAAVCLELSASEDVPAVDGFTEADRRRWGDTQVAFYTAG